MRNAIRFPQAGTATEAVFLQWNVARGERVAKDQVLATAETDKTVLELVAECDGVLDETCVEAGQEFPMSRPVGFLRTAADASGAAQPVASVAHETAQAAAVPTPADRAGQGAAAANDIQTLSPVRRRISENLLWVTSHTARASTTVEFDYGHIVELRQKYRAAFQQRHGFPLTFLPFVARAVCLALPRFPDVSAAMDIAGNTWSVRRHIALGIAVARAQGLVVPVLHGAQEMTLADLALGIQTLAVKARDGRLAAEDMQGGTFSITNPGSLGSVLSEPLLNRGETAILSIDAIEKRPVVADDAIVVGHRGYGTLAFDHRILDGSTAIEFLKSVKLVMQSGQLDQEARMLADA